jgi:predicted transcriptional regulator
MTSVTIRIDDEEKEAIQRYAEQHDLSMSWVIRKAIKEFLGKNN